MGSFYANLIPIEYYHLFLKLQSPINSPNDHYDPTNLQGLCNLTSPSSLQVRVPNFQTSKSLNKRRNALAFPLNLPETNPR